MDSGTPQTQRPARPAGAPSPKTYRGRGFYMLAGAICLVVVITLGVSTVISLLTLGLAQKQNGEALDAAIMAYDLYLQEISRGDHWQTEREVLEADNWLSNLDTLEEHAEEASKRLRTAEILQADSYDEVNVYLYDANADRLVGSSDSSRDPRDTNAALAALDLDDPGTRDTYVVFMAPAGPEGALRMVNIGPITPDLSLVRVSTMPELPGLEVLAPIADVAELYFVDSFGNRFAFTDRHELESELNYELLGAADGQTSGVRTLEFEGTPYRIYHHDVAPNGFTKFVLVAEDVVAEGHGRFVAAALVALGVLVAAGCLVAFALSRHVYEPVHQIVARLDPDGRNHDDEFKLIGFALSAMEKRLKDQEGQVERLTLMRLLRGVDTPTDERPPLFFDDPAAVCALAIVRPEGSIGMGALESAVRGCLAAHHRNCCIGAESGFLFVVFDAEGGATRAFFEPVLRAAQEACGVSLSAFVSDPHVGSGAPSLCYAEAMAILEQETRRGTFGTVVGADALAERPNRRGTHHGTTDLLEEMVHYVRMNYCDPDLTASSLARQFGVSQPTVSRLFKQTPEGSFLAYLHGLRIQKAIELLSQTGLPLNEVSRTVGYSTVTTMTRAFKRYTGKTPGTFRQEC